MVNDLSQKVIGLIGEYVKVGAEAYLRMQLAKIGKDLDNFEKKDIPNLVPVLEKACSILYGPEKTKKLIGDMNSI